MAGKKNRNWAQATRLVQEGTLRSQFGETSEAVFLNSGYVYDNAEEAEARFKGEAEGYVYSRYANPTVSMLEERMCALEGAEAARCTASGMAAVAASFAVPPERRRPCGLGTGVVRKLPLHRRRATAALRYLIDAG